MRCEADGCSRSGASPVPPSLAQCRAKTQLFVSLCSFCISNSFSVKAGTMLAILHPLLAVLLEQQDFLGWQGDKQVSLSPLTLARIRQSPANPSRALPSSHRV